MNPIRKILVPVDLGPLSRPAIDTAVELARAFGGAVSLLHVYEYSLWGIDGGPDSAFDAARRIREEAESALATLLDAYPSSDVQVTGIIREGIPWSETLNYAREISADLIVMSTHGRRGLPRALLGSVAEKIVRFATVPVLTLRGPEEPPKEKARDVKNSPEATGLPKGPQGLHDEEILAVSGAVTGAATGLVAGPPGVVAGAMIGAAMGMAIGRTLDDQDARDVKHDEALDEEIGVLGGDLGAGKPTDPPARIGAYSAGSAGATSTSTRPSEGPIQSMEDD